MGILEHEIITQNHTGKRNCVKGKKKALDSHLHEQAQEALIRAHISNIKDTDAPKLTLLQPTTENQKQTSQSDGVPEAP